MSTLDLSHKCAEPDKLLHMSMLLKRSDALIYESMRMLCKLRSSACDMK